jgi:hypothetical protein
MAGVLGLFAWAVKGEAVELTNENIEGISALCTEFSVRSLSQRLDGFARVEADVSEVQPAGEAKTAPPLTQLKSDVSQAGPVPVHSTAPAAESIPSSNPLSRLNPLRPLPVLTPRHMLFHIHAGDSLLGRVEIL